MNRKAAEDWSAIKGIDLERLFRESGNRAQGYAQQRGWQPRADIMEDESHVVVRFELSGVRPNEYHLAYRRDRHSLTVRGYRRDQQAEQGVRVHLLEIECGEFFREVSLPDVEIAIDHTRTHFHAGILLVVIPKSGSMIVEHTVTIRKI